MRGEPFEELRRKAYVDGLMIMQEEDNLLGYFGDVDEAMLRAYGFIGLPAESLDGYIFKYGRAPGCDVVAATSVYLETGKCPILFASKAYLFDGSCPKLSEAVRQRTEKPSFDLSRSTYAEVLTQLGGTYSKERHREAKRLLKEADTLLEALRATALDGRTLFEIAFYLRYETDLQERISLLKDVLCRQAPSRQKRIVVTAPCPGGIVYGIAEKQTGHYEIRGRRADGDYGCPGCIYAAGTYFNYKGENDE